MPLLRRRHADFSPRFAQCTKTGLFCYEAGPQKIRSESVSTLKKEKREAAAQRRPVCRFVEKTRFFHEMTDRMVRNDKSRVTCRQPQQSPAARLHTAGDHAAHRPEQNRPPGLRPLAAKPEFFPCRKEQKHSRSYKKIWGTPGIMPGPCEERIHSLL